MPDFVDEAHERIAAFAAEFLEEDERDDFVDGLLERRGYQRVTSWAAPEPDPAAAGQGRAPLLKQGQRGGQAAAGRGGGQRQPAEPSGGGRGNLFQRK